MAFIFNGAKRVFQTLVVSPVSFTWEAVKTTYELGPTRAFQAASRSFQKNLWYTPHAALSQARTSLIALRSIFTTTLTPENRAKLRNSLTTASDDLATMLGELNTHRDFYSITQEQEDVLVGLQRYLVGMAQFIQTQQTATELLFSRTSPKAEFLRFLTTALEIADPWGQPHGPGTAIKKRVIKPVYQALVLRPTEEMKECQRLTEALQNPGPSATPEQIKQRAERLVHVIDCIVQQRCPTGISSYEMLELTPLLLLQADLEEILSTRSGQALSTDLLTVRTISPAREFLSYYAQPGYRPRLTQKESDSRLTQTRQALTIFRETPNLADIPSLERQIDQVLISYANRSEETLVPLREAKKALQEVRRSRAITTLDPRSIEQIRFAEEQLTELHTAQQGWVPRTTSSISFRPTYTPPQPLVNAYHNIKRVALILANDTIPNHDLVTSAQAAAQEIHQFLTWLRLPENDSLYTIYFRRRLQELANHLQTLPSQADPRAFLRTTHSELFLLVKTRLEVWSQPGIFGGKTLPSINTHACHALQVVKQTGGILNQAFLSRTEDRVVVPTQRFEQALSLLEAEINANLIEMQPQDRVQLLRSIQSFKTTIQIPNWHTDIQSREHVLESYRTLESDLVQFIDSTTSRPNAQPQIEWNPQQAIMAPEFRILLDRLERLNQAFISRNPEEILNHVRTTWSLSQAMLEQDRGNESLLAKRYHLTPKMIFSLRELSNALDRALRKQNTGSCDPTSPGFFFRHQPSATDGALATYSSYNAVQESLHFLLYWKEHHDPIPVFGDAQRYVGQKTTQYMLGDPLTSLPQLPSALMRRADRLYVDSLSITELKERSTSVIKELKRNLTRASASEESVTPILRPLQRFLEPATSTKSQDEKAAREALARFISQEQIKHHKRHLEQNARRPLTDGGLFGRALNSAVGKVTGTLGLSENSMISSKLREGVQWVHSQVSERISSSDVLRTPNPAEEERTERHVHFATDTDSPEIKSERTRRAPSKVAKRGERLEESVVHSPPSKTSKRSAPVHTPLRPSLHKANTSIMGTIGSVLENSLQFFNKAKREGWTKTAIETVAEQTAKRLHGYIDGLDPTTDKESISRLKGIERTIRNAGRDHAVLDDVISATTKGLEYMGVLPSSDTDGSDTHFLDLETMCDDALQFNQRRTPIQRPIQELLNEEKENFVKNNSTFIPMKLLYEYVCGNPAKDISFYSEMIQKAKAAGPENEERVLKEALIEELKKAKTSWFLRTVVGWFYIPIISIARHFLGKFSGRGVDWVRDFIAKNNRETSSAFANRVVDRTNGFMAKLQSAYRRIANKQVISGNISDELKKELSHPEVNNGISQEELYQKAADKFFDEFIAPDLCNWGHALWKRLTTYHFEEGSTADTVVHYFLTALACVTAPVAWILSWPASWVLSGTPFYRGLGKRYIVNGPLIHTLVNETVGSIEQNGYTHALNCVLYEWLRDVLITLRRQFSKTQGTDPQKDGPSSPDLKEMSMIEKAKLHTLLKETFSVLKKHKCGSPEELRKLVNNDSMLGKLKGEVEDRVYDKATEGALELIGAAFHSLLKKDQLETLFYQLTSTINGIYEKAQPIPKEEFKAKEEGINKLLDAILTLVVSNAVDENLDPSIGREKEEKAANRFLRELEKTSKDLKKTLRKRYEILRTQAPHGKLPTTREAQDALDSLLQQVQHSIHKLIDLRTRIDSCADLSETKGQLQKHLTTLHHKLKTIVTSLTSLKHPHARRVLATKVKEPIALFNRNLASIQEHLQSPTRNTIEYARQEIGELYNLLERFRHEPSLEDVAYNLEQELQRLDLTYKQTLSYLVLEDELQGDLSISSGYLCKWYGMLGTAAMNANPMDAREAYARVQTSLRNLAESPEEQHQLQELVDEMKKHPNNKVSIFKKLMKTHAAILQKNRLSYEKAKEALGSIRRHCEKTLKSCRFDQAIPPANGLFSIEQGIEHFEQWTQEHRAVQCKTNNTGLLQRSVESIKHAVKKPTKKAIVSYVRSEVDNLLSFIRNPTIWRAGLFHSNILEPFIEES
ncbi:MAG: hypothetical protein KGZ39_02765 [Simkania sp.]|nr:hypothetical protein [Simkania sp.]